jgi:2-dehydropantoate 2-reductase
MPLLSTIKKPHIAIIGAGAVGSFIGALLAHVGEHVTIIGRKHHVDHIKANGLHVLGTNTPFTVTIDADETLLFKPDIAILAVKMQDLETTCRSYAPLLTDIPVITLQNGIQCDTIVQSVLGSSQKVSGIVLFNAQFIKPGQVTQGAPGAIMLGDPFCNNTPALDRAQSLLSRAVPVTITDAVHAARWTKLIMNCMNNVLDAATGLSLNECMDNAILREIGICLVREAFAVLDAAHITPVTLPGFNALALKGLVALPMPEASALLQQRMKKSLGHNIVSSTLQSLRRHKPTEIEYLNAEFVREGERLSVPTPCNRRMVNVIHTIEKTGVFYSPEELIKIFDVPSV